ncbi:prostate androgen-regulated mucin-like protein 1 isoform X2 [Ahaetulla prasina]|uniref:prostate androgen-regulated mucin-like protein 1 isoform X2 n=1 Tax=Ahaetulla prasina TaxID=499056 RepID=UPI002648B72C|nr:prostate androgen-regulated mucin-like protein 1 isoform X2 [Ahaetulla prasina]
MSPEGGRAPSLLCLIVIAAGLNIYSISSVNTSIISNILKTELINQTLKLNSSLSTNIAETVTSPVTLSFITTLTPVENDTISLSTPNETSSTSVMTVSTTNLLSKPSTGTQSPEHIPTSVMPVPSSATTNISPAPTTTSGIVSVSSISSSSFAPENYTSSWVTKLSSTEVSTVPVTSKKHTVEGITSGVTTNPLTSSSSVGTFTYSQGTSASKATVETIPTGSATLSSEVTMQEVQQALSSGSIAAITITVIAVVLLVFGIAAFLKIRHSSYGRLFDDHDYGSWGNYNNPLYDDS